MTHSTKSVVSFGIYLLVLGLALVIVPEPLVAFGGFGSVEPVFARLLGWMVFALGYLYLLVGRLGLFPFAKTTVSIRLLGMAFQLILVFLGLAPPALLVFGGVDVAGAVWTLLALKADAV